MNIRKFYESQEVQTDDIKFNEIKSYFKETSVYDICRELGSEIVFKKKYNHHQYGKEAKLEVHIEFYLKIEFYKRSTDFENLKKSIQFHENIVAIEKDLYSIIFEIEEDKGYKWGIDKENWTYSDKVLGIAFYVKIYT
jgi:hypothetical protein